MKKTLFIWIVLSLASVAAKAQYVRLDSLKEQLAIAKEDTNKVKALLTLSGNYTWSYADTSLIYAQQAMDLAQDLNYERGVLWAQLHLSQSLTTLGNYPLALDYGFKALAWGEKNNSSYALIRAHAIIALCYREQGDYKNGLAHCRKAIALSEPLGSYELNSNMWGTAASVYEKNNQLDSAILYAKKALDVQSKWSGVLYVLGSAYSKKNDYDSAMFYYRAGIPNAVINHTEIDLIDIYNGIAGIHKSKGNIDSASWYAKKALSEKVGQNYPLGLLQSANLLVELYQSQNKADSTLKYLRVSLVLKETLFNREKTIAIQTLAFERQENQKEIETAKLESRNRIRMNAMLGSLFTISAIAFLLFRTSRLKQKAKDKIEKAFEQLKSTQAQLVQSEKMASLGELTAGIAHEIQNPLNFVNNFSDVNKELAGELEQEIDKGNYSEAKTLAKDIKENEEKINHHGKRADAIVKGMLQHSRSTSGVNEPTDINALCDEYLRLAYHGLRAKDKSFNTKFETHLDPTLPKANVLPQDLGRVIVNLVNNAFYSVNEKQKAESEKLNPDAYEPLVIMSTKNLGNKIEIAVKDNGNGIPDSIKDKIFQPFFTTKPAGQGTGLGLSLSYDIVKAHGGELIVQTTRGKGSEFIVKLPFHFNS